ncbi:MAG TPA: type II toxin-antitoxin system VapC family toxin [Solirubrobacterales bacterium]
MREAVLDASVVLKWFHHGGEMHAEAAGVLRGDFEAGELRVIAPPLLWLEIINVAARRWRWDSSQLEALAASLSDLGFELVEPEPEAIARWAGRGLTAYDAAYVAVAEETGAPVITDDAQICRLAKGLSEPLSQR